MEKNEANRVVLNKCSGSITLEHNNIGYESCEKESSENFQRSKYINGCPWIVLEISGLIINVLKAFVSLIY